MDTLILAAQIAGAFTVIVTAIALLCRYLFRLLLLALAEHLPEILDKTLAFNGTGSFRKDMRHFYQQFHEHVAYHGRDTHRANDL